MKYVLTIVLALSFTSIADAGWRTRRFQSCQPCQQTLDKKETKESETVKKERHKPVINAVKTICPWSGCK